MSDDLDDIDPDDIELPPSFDPRAVPMSWTVLSEYRRSPAHARYKAERGRTDEGTLAMKLGRGFHAVALEQPYAVYSETKQRRGKVWDAFKAAHAGMPILTPGEHAKAFAMAHALHSNRDAERLIYGDGVIREGLIEWVRDGRAMTSHVDFRKPGVYLGDLKGVKSAELGRYQYAGLRDGHHAQVKLYEEADAYQFGRDVDDEIPLYLVTIENSEPFCVVVWELDAFARDSAKKMIARWWERMKSCEAANHWPGYSQAICQFTADDPETTEGFSLAEPRERPTEDDEEQAA